MRLTWNRSKRPRPAIRRRRTTLTLVATTASAVLISTASAGTFTAADAAPAAPEVTAYTGSLIDGATWKAEVPANWNGTLLLYSHGYLPSFFGAPNLPADAPDAATAAALLAEGYGLTGSSYAAAGWALNTAPADQLDTLDATIKAIGRRPHRVLAVGTSMGGLVTAKLAEIGAGRIQGALPTCGIVGGGAALGNYQLDGAFAIARLLLPQQQLTLTRYPDVATAVATSNALIAAVKQAQGTAEGRARIALAAALYQEPDWLPGQQPPAANDPEAIELGQYQWLLQTLQFTTPARFDIETAMGGNPAWNKGVDYRRLLKRSTDRDTVRALYGKAGLSLTTDLRALTGAASTTADPKAVARIFATSVPFGRVAMPVLSLHTTDDQLVPVQQENAYRNAVARAGRSHLLRQAFIARQGHCSFTPAELVAAVHALDHRVSTGRWDGLTTPEALQNAATGLGLSDAAFVRFRPGHLLRESFGGDDRIPFALPRRSVA